MTARTLTDRGEAVDPVLLEIIAGSLASIEKEVETAIARAKQEPGPSYQGLLAALDAKYPGKKMRFEGDMYGYDEPWFNPETRAREQIFQPVMHISLIQALKG